MKNHSIFLTSILIFSFCSSPRGATQQVLTGALSPRIGNEIVSIEQEYFGLFPEIEGFISAKVSELADHGVRFVVTRSKNGFTGDTVFSIGALTARNLAIYIEDFELYRSKETTVNRSHFAGLVGRAPALKNRMNDGAEVTIETQSARRWRC